MNHTYSILKKVDLVLCSTPKTTLVLDPGLRTLKCFIFILRLPAYTISVKILKTDLVFAKLTYFIFGLAQGVNGLAKDFVTVIIICRHRIIMICSEKLSDIIAFAKCEAHYI